jgi:uncharacterized protein YifN (PemK superfamily)
MDRESMIDVIVNDLQDWEKRDRWEFWDHVQELERSYLNKMSDKELVDLLPPE